MTEITDDTPYGSRLIVHVLEEKGRLDPGRLLVSIPNSPSDPAKGWRPISFSAMANAVNHTAHWLEKQLGRPDPNITPTLAYIGLGDIRYFVIMLAAIKVGYAAFLPSTRNNTEAIVSLFKETDVKCLLYSPDSTKLAQTWLMEYPTNSLQVPAIEDLVKDELAEPYPYNDTYETAKEKPAVILHSSGTTGIPKAIPLRNSLLAAIDALHYYPTFNGFEHMKRFHARVSKCSLTPVPLFHAYGIFSLVNSGILFDVGFAIGLAGRPITGDLVIESIEYSGSDSLSTTPSVLDEILAQRRGIELLKKMKFVMCGGGGTSTNSLNIMRANNIQFTNVIGSTETGSVPIYRNPNPENWEYFIFNDKVFGAEYMHIEDNLYEQKLVRRPELAGQQGIFATFPDKDEYKIGDMYEAHPTLPNHWKYKGRADSIIVFSNGEKLNPVTIESIVGEHENVKHALVVGRGQFQAGMIVEPKSWPEGEAEKAALLESILPYVEKANTVTVHHGRIAPNFVVLANPDKEFPYTPKGSLRRNVALELYADEIKGLYQGQDVVEAAPLDIKTQETLQAGVGALFRSVSESADIGDNDDFFLNGIDSLHVIESSRRLTAGLKAAGIDGNVAVVNARDIYRNNTVAKLSQFLFSKTHGTYTNGVAKDNTAFMQSLVDKYTAGLQKNSASKPPARASNKAVLLTGSTGSLGSYMLHFLINAPDVAKVICLNRSEDGGHSRQLESSQERGLSTDFAKVTFLHADLSKPDLGLATADFASLRETDCIVHNAWPVNFNLTVESFEGHIRGVRHLIDVALSAARNTSVVFVSSIATVSNWSSKCNIPESYLPDLKLAGKGYGESKLASSHILHAAAEHAGIPTAIIRLGQVGGPTTQAGQWNRREWLPTIVESSVKLGVLPDSLGSMAPITWMPVDKVARIILDVVDSTTASPKSVAQYLNLVNPTPVEWKDLSPAVLEFYKKHGKELKLVGTKAWVDAVRNAPPVSKLSAFKLLDTFQGMADDEDKRAKSLDTAKLRAVSKTLAQLGPMTPELMSLWCQQWRFAA